MNTEYLHLSVIVWILFCVQIDSCICVLLFNNKAWNIKAEYEQNENKIELTRKCFGPDELWQLAESKSIKLDQAHNLIRHMLLLGADNLLMLILFEYQAHIICFSGISQSGTYY